MLKLAPGGPFDAERSLPAETQRNLERRYNLNLPVAQQYLLYMGALVRGDLGHSMKRNQSVKEIIDESFGVSVRVGLLALVFATAFGIALGVFAASRQNTWWDHGAMAFALFGISVPSFVLGPLLIMVFSLQLGWLPPARIDGLETYLLPAATLGLIFMGVIARLARSGLLETLRQDYIRTARAKGLSERQVVWKHAVRLGLMPVVTYLGPATAALITGSFVVEKIFQIPGLGFYFVASITDRDDPVLTGVLVFYAVFLVALNLIVDIAYGILDPRIRDKR
ncbi:MAG: ABC transporter permease [Deltaproteobacteria bacterium]|nr:MAG: ABC transporter permease [Deltaproteobacteria bacterium]